MACMYFIQVNFVLDSMIAYSFSFQKCKFSFHCAVLFILLVSAMLIFAFLCLERTVSDALWYVSTLIWNVHVIISVQLSFFSIILLYLYLLNVMAVVNAVFSFLVSMEPCVSFYLPESWQISAFLSSFPGSWERSSIHLTLVGYWILPH